MSKVITGLISVILTLFPGQSINNNDVIVQSSIFATGTAIVNPSIGSHSTSTSIVLNTGWKGKVYYADDNDTVLVKSGVRANIIATPFIRSYINLEYGSTVTVRNASVHAWAGGGPDVVVQLPNGAQYVIPTFTTITIVS